jgi:drug/metabolite transporter (DMT)-like permease
VSPSPPSKLADWTWLVVCNLVWADQFVLVKIVQSQAVHVGPLTATMIPILGATLLLIPAVYHESRSPQRMATRASRRLRRTDLLGFLAVGLLGQFCTQVSVTWGMNYTLASNAALLMLALPVLTAVMAFLILGESMSVLRWVSFAFALAGASMSSGIDWTNLAITDRQFALGNGLVLVCAATSAFYNVYSKILLNRYTALQVMLGSYIVMLIALLPLTLWREPEVITNLVRYNAKIWLGLALLASLNYFGAMVIFLWVLARLDAIQAGLCNYLIPFFGLVIAWLVLRESLTPLSIVGGVLVLVSTLLVTIADTRQAARATAALRPAMSPEEIVP